MTTATNVMSWPGQAEGWLDSKGPAAWIAAMVLGFVFVWPVGLALLIYMLATGKFKGGRRRAKRMRAAGMAFKSSGNEAFDAYKAETLRRLEDEQAAFEDFLRRLREARDKAEFDQFMDDRARSARDATPKGGRDHDEREREDA